MDSKVNNDTQMRAIGSVLMSLLSMQLGSALAKQLFAGIGGRGVTCLRTAGATLLLGLLWRPFRQVPPKKAWAPLFGYGLAIGTMNLAFYQAIETIPLGIAIALDFSGPLVIVFVKSRRRTDVAWGLLAALGLVVLLPIFATSAPLDTKGVLWALGSGASWMGYILCGQKVTRHMSAGPALAWAMLLATIITLPVGIAFAGTKLLDPTVLMVSLGVAFFSSAAPYSLELYAMGRLKSHTFSTLMSLEPAIGALAGLFFLGERVTRAQGAGILAIVVATAGAANSSRVQPADPSPETCSR